jgi:hypothetical protein
VAVVVRRRSSGSGPGPTPTFDLEALCTAAENIGDAVYINADKVGDKYQVRKVDVDDVADTKKAIGIGILTDKESATECTVRLFGALTGVYGGLQPGARLFVGTDSRPNTTPPAYPGGGKRILQKIGYVLASDTIMVSPEEPTRIIPL